ncbi:MAG TPA: type I methionyl aminopeptidase [Phycisphaerae bacterium]|nr:type I methionyl aminopeptidase [Phycisphaerae bacterium]HNU44472.1 type I methionyl aminopeptidase [Phycisphaerae bacterium]
MAGTGGVILKSRREIDLMRRAGRVVREVLDRLTEMVRPGVTTAELNTAAEELIAAAGGAALFKGVRQPQARRPFPAVICASVNEELVHGIPGPRELREGDIISVDCGVRLDGYCGDAATTVRVGKVTPEVAHLVEVTQRALELVLEVASPGKMWSEVARQLQAYVEGEGLSVVRDFVGHGIGREMHEDPKVPNFWNERQKGLDFPLQPGLVLAVEPMVNLGTHAVEYGDEDRWVVVTRDRKPAAHFEHTIAVTARGVDVLTV